MEDKLQRIPRLHGEQPVAIRDCRKERENDPKSKPIDGVILAVTSDSHDLVCGNRMNILKVV